MSGRPSWKSAEIGQNRPFSAFFALFRRVRRAPGKSRKRRKKVFFLRYPQICLNPHLLNPHLRHPKVSHFTAKFGPPPPQKLLLWSSKVLPNHFEKGPFPAIFMINNSNQSQSCNSGRASTCCLSPFALRGHRYPELRQIFPNRANPVKHLR